MSTPTWCPPTAGPGGPASPGLPGPDPRSAQHCVGWTPSLLTAALVDALRTHFADPSSRLVARDPAVIWRPGRSSDIVIKNTGAWSPRSQDNHYPALIVKRQPYRPRRSTLGGGIGPDREGHENYAQLWIGSHTIFAIQTASEAAAEVLADEAVGCLQVFGAVATRQLGVHDFRVVELGTPGLLEGAADDTFVVPITCAAALEQTWRILEDGALPLKSFEFQKTPPL